MLLRDIGRLMRTCVDGDRTLKLLICSVLELWEEKMFRVSINCLPSSKFSRGIPVSFLVQYFSKVIY